MPGTVPGFGGDDNDGKTGLCSQEPLGVCSAANHTNKPALARRWLLINSPLEVAYVCFWRPCNSAACGGGSAGESQACRGGVFGHTSLNTQCLVDGLLGWCPLVC